MPIYHNLTATTPDDPAYEIRPSHWNSDHAISLSGSEVIGAFSNAGNVSFAVETNGRITASANVTAAASPVAVTAGTTSGNLQTIAFSNSNGISFGLNGSTITASHNALTSQSNQAFSAPGGSSTFQTLVFANSNGVSFSNSNGSVVATVATNYLTTAAASDHSHGNPTLALTNLTGTTASNSAGFTLSLSAAAAGGAASQTAYFAGNTTISTSGTQPLSSLQMRGYGIVSVGQSNGSYLISTPDPSTLVQLSAGVSGGNTAGHSGTVAQGQIVFAGGANITLSGSTNGSSMTVSVVGGAGGAGYSAGISTGGNTAGATGLTGSNMVFVGAGPVSLSQTTGANGGTISINAPATSSLSATGNASISVNGSTISLGANAAAVSLSGNSTSAGAGYSNVSTGTLYLAGGNNITLSQNGASVTISGANAGGAQTAISGMIASDATYTSGTVSFSNQNGVTIGSSVNGATQYIRLSVANQSVQTQASGDIAGSGVTTAGNNIGLSGTLNSAGLSLSATVAAQSVQPVAVSGQNGSYAFSTLSMSNANGISFGTSAGSAITASYTVPSTAGLISAIGVTGSNGNYTTTGLSFSNGNGISFGTSAGSAITASHNALTSQSNQAASAANGSFAFQTVLFSNANGVSFATSAGSAIAASVETSYAASNHSHGNPTLALTNLSGTTASASNGLTISLSAAAPGGGVTPAISAANGSYSFSTLSLSNANGISFGTSAGSAVTASYTVPTVTQYFSKTNTTFNGANISGSMTINTDGLQLSMSVAAPGAAAENNAIALLGANTAGNTTATGSTIGWSGVNLTLSGTNASQVVISAPATSSLSATGQVSISTNGSTISIGVPNRITRSGYNKDLLDREFLLGQLGQNQLFVQPLDLIDAVQFDQFVWPNNYTATSNSSGSVTLTLQVGIYTRNVSTLSLASSFSSSYAATNSGTVGSYSIYGGMRNFPIATTVTMTEGAYWLGFLSRTTTGGAAGMTFSNYVGSNINVALSGQWSSAANASNQYVLGMGSFNTTTTALPNSLAFTAISGSAAANLRPIIYQMVSATI